MDLTKERSEYKSSRPSCFDGNAGCFLFAVILFSKNTDSVVRLSGKRIRKGRKLTAFFQLIKTGIGFFDPVCFL